MSKEEDPAIGMRTALIVLAVLLVLRCTNAAAVLDSDKNNVVSSEDYEYYESEESYYDGGENVQEVTASAAQTVELSCRDLRGVAKPRPKLMWYKDGRAINKKAKRRFGKPYEFRKVSPDCIMFSDYLVVLKLKFGF